MDLHELFSTAVADLPDVPDQGPAAQRIRRRRTAVARSSAIAAASAQVVGVVTVVDRGTGAAEAIEAEGIPYRSVLGLADLGLS